MENHFKYCADTAKLYPNIVFINKENIIINELSQIDDFVFFNGGIGSSIGRNVHISSFVSIVGGGELEIGDFAGLSAGCRIVTGTDDFEGNSLTNPTVSREFRNITIGKIKIGKHAILGTNVVVLPNTVIGDGCIVGSGSIVNKDLEPWTIYAGFKPRKVGQRSKDKIESLESSYLNEL